MAAYQTKVMRPANLRGVSTVRDTLDQVIEDAEQKSVSGDIALTLTMKKGTMVGARVTTTKLVPIEEQNI